jgi:HD-GYP domain-containing protein (c-di-GMP phosphodiesterase class II)
MLVHFVTDNENKIPAVRAMLEPKHAVEAYVLAGTDEFALSNGVLLVDANLGQMVLVERLKTVFRNLYDVSERLFVLPDHQRHHMATQAFALGATAIVSRPHEIVVKLSQLEREQKPLKPEAARAAGEPDEIASSAACFASMFSAIGRGKPITLGDAEKATSEVIDGVKRSGLNAWLDDVRRYHEGTFQHCLLVTGVAVAFGLNVKFPDADVRRLGLAATLHDIGKARIPLAILDKPGRLDQGELNIIERHPIIGYDLLKVMPEIGPDILDGVRHHHEYLDGSGYPDQLTAPQISDLVRLLTISDIFAALIERRPHRPPLSKQEAYKVLCGMDGKLEAALLRAFRSVALS